MTAAQSPEAPLAREYLPAIGAARQDLLLLHGWGGSRELWRPLLASLRDWANVTLVDLPGLNPLLPLVADQDLDALLPRIADAAPAGGVVLGWSLGGQLAAELAHRFPQRVEALVTVCSNPRFVAGGDWPGMSPELFAQFRDAVAQDPVDSLRRFAGLQAAGASRKRPLLRELQTALPRQPDAAILTGLGWLAALDTRATLRVLEQPQLHLFSGADGLVPAGVAPAVRGLLGPGAVDRLPCGSHAAPLEAPAQLAAKLQDFLEKRGLLRDCPECRQTIAKGDVAASFTRAAPGYDAAAALQRAVGDSLLRRLDREQPRRAAVTRVLDLGCGTGHFGPALQSRFPDADYLGLDLAPGMVAHARAQADACPGAYAATHADGRNDLNRHGGDRDVDRHSDVDRHRTDVDRHRTGMDRHSTDMDRHYASDMDRGSDMDRHCDSRGDSYTGARGRYLGQASWLVADAESLPLAAGSVDLVFSSLALQWCERPALFLAELARVLRPGGLCVFSTLGPGTLAELRAAWTRVDGHRHVNRFTPAGALAQAAEPLGAVRLSLGQEIHRMQYPRALDLLRELKTLGAHNMNADRPAGLTGRRRLQSMFDAYEAFREEGGLPATYDVILGVMHRP